MMKKNFLILFLSIFLNIPFVHANDLHEEVIQIIASYIQENCNVVSIDYKWGRTDSEESNVKINYSNIEFMCGIKLALSQIDNQFYSQIDLINAKNVSTIKAVDWKGILSKAISQTPLVIVQDQCIYNDNSRILTFDDDGGIAVGLALNHKSEIIEFYTKK